MSNNNQKSGGKIIIQDDFQKSITHERPEPQSAAPTSRSSNQQEIQTDNQNINQNKK
jgi:hypothetical protein